MMPKGAKYWEAITREVVERNKRRAKAAKAYILSDGHPPGTVPMSKDEEAVYLARIARYLPEIAQRDPKRAAEMMRRIDQIMEAE